MFLRLRQRAGFPLLHLLNFPLPTPADSAAFPAAFPPAVPAPNAIPITTPDPPIPPVAIPVRKLESSRKEPVKYSVEVEDFDADSLSPLLRDTDQDPVEKTDPPKETKEPEKTEQPEEKKKSVLLTEVKAEIALEIARLQGALVDRREIEQKMTWTSLNRNIDAYCRAQNIMRRTIFRTLIENGIKEARNDLAAYAREQKLVESHLQKKEEFLEKFRNCFNEAAEDQATLTELTKLQEQYHKLLQEARTDGMPFTEDDLTIKESTTHKLFSSANENEQKKQQTSTLTSANAVIPIPLANFSIIAPPMALPTSLNSPAADNALAQVEKNAGETEERVIAQKLQPVPFVPPPVVAQQPDPYAPSFELLKHVLISPQALAFWQKQVRYCGGLELRVGRHKTISVPHGIRELMLLVNDLNADISINDKRALFQRAHAIALRMLAKPQQSCWARFKYNTCDARKPATHELYTLLRRMNLDDPDPAALFNHLVTTITNTAALSPLLQNSPTHHAHGLQFSPVLCSRP